MPPPDNLSQNKRVESIEVACLDPGSTPGDSTGKKSRFPFRKTPPYRETATSLPSLNRKTSRFSPLLAPLNSTRTPHRTGRKTPKTGSHSLLFAHGSFCRRYFLRYSVTINSVRSNVTTRTQCSLLLRGVQIGARNGILSSLTLFGSDWER